MRPGRVPHAAGSAWGIPLLLLLLLLAVTVLAVLDVLRLRWIADSWFDLASVTVVIATGAAGLSSVLIVIVRAARERARVRRLLHNSRMPIPASLLRAAEALDLSVSIDVVASAEPLAFTHRLRHPRILLSTGLLEALNPQELDAVLAHEHCHLLRRDPLRLLAAHVLAGYVCFLPSAAHLARRTAQQLELAADRAALAHADRAHVAAALLKLVDAAANHKALSPNPAMGAGRRARDDALRARIEQLEGADPPRPRARRRFSTAAAAAATGANALVLGAAAMCCVGLSQALPGGIL